MPAPIATNLRTVLPLVTTQLATVTGISSNRILIAQRPLVPHIQGDQDLVVRIGPPQASSDFDGSGRVCTVVARVLQVTPRTRWAVDQGDRDDQWILDPTYGHSRLEESVVDALHNWIPSDANNNFLTIEPITWNPSSPPIRETPENSSWGHTDLTFTIRYILSLTDNGF